MPTRKIIVPLAGYYACYFAGLGVWINLGQESWSIGLLTAVAMWIKVLGAPLWGRWADQGSRHWVTVITSFATCAVFALFFTGTGFSFLLTVTLLFSFFHAGPLALVEVTTLETIAKHGGDYGRIRLWGSIGFILLAMGMGPLVDRFGWQLVPIFLFFLFFIAGFISLLLPNMASMQKREKGSGGGMRTLLRRPGVGWFYLSTLLMQFSHGTYYGFFSLHLHNHGFSGTSIGLLWALGVVSEVVFLYYSRFLLGHFGVAWVLSLSFALAGLRWGLYAVTLWWPVLIFGQMLHAFTFGSFHVAAVRRTFAMATLHTRASAQAWYAAFSFGIGGGFGQVISGFFMDTLGAKMLFGLMAAVAGLGWLACQRASQKLQGVEKEL
ncbi:MAG: MFS transporter [Magnetococcus sp. DMHC-6]